MPIPETEMNRIRERYSAARAAGPVLLHGFEPVTPKRIYSNSDCRRLLGECPVYLKDSAIEQRANPSLRVLLNRFASFLRRTIARDRSNGRFFRVFEKRDRVGAQSGNSDKQAVDD